MEIKANGISMNYEISGKGENLVLIHGAGDNLNMWYHQVPVFSQSYRVTTFDFRGSGQTEAPKTEYSISLLAEDAYQLMTAIKVTSAHFLGYSMGGRIARELASNHPEMVKTLILANSSLGLTPPSTEAVERRRAFLELLEQRDIEGFADMMTTSAFSPGFKLKNPTEFKRYQQVKMQNNTDGLIRIMRLIATPSPPPDLSKLSCPVLLIVGENDPNLGVGQGKQAQEALAGSEVVVLPTGHAAAIESPERFNSAVLEFLSSL